MKASPAHQVLFLDDDREFLEAMRDMCEVLSGGAWKIHTAVSPDAATELLKANAIQLLVVDMNMPVLDGIQFTGLVRRQHPALKIAMLTSDASDEKRAAALAAGAELFLQKTHSPEGMKAVFTMLGELLHWTPREGSPGAARSVSLPDVIQMECTGRNSSVIEVSNDQMMGRIHIENGQITHASGGELTGERALQQLLSLPGSAFELAPFEAPEQRTITSPWEMLLAAATHRSVTAAPKVNGAEAGDKTVTPLDGAAQAVTETVICTGTGEPLYHDGGQPEARMQWLMAVAQQAAIFNSTISLGHFDRMELQYPDGRAVAQAREDRLVYVRSSTRQEGGA
jgi:CheY-like chemotaxis protein